MDESHNIKGITQYTLIKDGQVITSETHYRGSTISAIFHQTDANTLTVLLDERLSPHHFLKMYVGCVLIGMIPFLLAYVGNDIPLYGVLISFVVLSILIVIFRYYKVNFAHEYVFKKQDRSYVRSRLHVKPIGLGTGELASKELNLSGVKKRLSIGVISHLICYKGNIGTESPFSIFIIDTNGNRTSFINTMKREQVIDYCKVISEFLEVPTSFVKYWRKIVDWRQE